MSEITLQTAGPIVYSLHQTFIQSIKDDLERNYLQFQKSVTKWTCVSDYSLDSVKANDVITFSFFPYTINHEDLSELIKKLAPVEIKKAKKINPGFLSFLKEAPVLSFSIVLENFNFLYFNNEQELRNSLIETFRMMLRDIPQWDIARPDLRKYHSEIEKEAMDVIRLLQEGKKITVIKNLLLITLVGSYFACMIANYTNAEKIAWFSDRDAIHEVGDQFSSALFQIYFNQFLINEKTEFYVAPAISTSTEWYKELVKIPDFISGAIADYNMQTDQTTHDKFTPLLREVIAENNKNIFIIKMSGDPFSMSRIIATLKS